ncbi:unnamed protein product [Polarella glacialis]|uniref:Helicase-associated domain-containing protein n=1 Tax=Polarella glacialis TaxID=89957 RepID=A0A813GT89_POLGL|nr:unnamed protein product [Polarella glacialis]
MWERRFGSLQQWVGDHRGILPGWSKTASQEERSLAFWLHTVLAKAKQGVLQPDRLEQLRSIPAAAPLVSNAEAVLAASMWEDMFRGLQTWVEEHNDAMPSNHDTADEQEKEMSTWLGESLAQAQKGHLELDRLERLRSIPVVANWILAKSPRVQRYPDIWGERFQSLKKWLDQHNGQLPSEEKNASDEERNLAQWFSLVMAEARYGWLDFSRMTQLQSIGAVALRLLSKNDELVLQSSATWDEIFHSFQDWVEKHGNSLPGRTQNSTLEERRLVDWLSESIERARNGDLTFDRVERLRSIPAVSHLMTHPRSFLLTSRSSRWQERFRGFKDWVHDHGGSLPVYGLKVTAEERKHAVFFLKSLKMMKQGYLNVDEKEELLQLPGVAERLAPKPHTVRRDGWTRRYQSLQTFMEERDGALPKQTSSDVEERQLAGWLKMSLRSARQGSLPVEKVEQLMEIVAVSNRLEAPVKSWDDSFALLQQWLDDHGEVLPRYSNAPVEEQQVAKWLSNVLWRARKGLLALEKVQQLQNILPMAEMLEDAEEGAPVKSWDDSFALLQRWFDDHGGVLPRHGEALADEHQLAKWLSNVLWRARKGLLALEKVQRLQKFLPVAKMLEDAKGEGEKELPLKPAAVEIPLPKLRNVSRRLTWKSSYQRLQTWVEQHDGVLPGYGQNPSDEEKKLAWLLRVALRHETEGSLPLDKVARLRKIVAVSEELSASPPRTLRWDARFAELQQWLHDHHGTRPSQISAAYDEHKLVIWIKTCLSESNQCSLEQVQQLQNLLSDTDPQANAETLKREEEWEGTYCRLQSWKNRHGGASPQNRRDASADERQLAVWLSENRQQMSRMVLDQGLQNLLADQANAEILKHEEEWEGTYCRVQSWMNMHGGALPQKSRTASADERQLAFWLAENRLQMKTMLLDLAKLEKLLEIPGIAAPRPESWWNAFFRLRSWMNKHDGALPQKSKSSSAEESQLGIWLTAQLGLASSKDLEPAKIEKLLEVPAIADRWTRRQESTFCRLQRWVEQHGGALPKKSKSACDEERQLAVWLHVHLSKMRNQALELGKVEELLTIPAIADQVANGWLNVKRNWSENFGALQQWVEEHGGNLPTQRADASKEEKALASWLSAYLTQARQGSLQSEMLSQLRTIPAITDRLEQKSVSIPTWSGRYDALQNWVEAHGGELPTVSMTASEEEKSLSKWLFDSLKKARKGTLQTERFSQLQEIPAVADQLTEGSPKVRQTWSESCSALQHWVQEHGGHLPTGSSSPSKEEWNLYCWLSDGLKKARSGILPADRLSELLEIPGIADKLKNGPAKVTRQWADMHHALQQWVQEHGGDLPRIRKTADEEERSLSSWLQNNVRKASEGSLEADRVVQLQNIPAVAHKLANPLRKSKDL